LGERVAHCKVYGFSAVSCAEVAKPIDLPFGLWTRVGRRKHKFNHIRQGGANVRTLEDTFAPHIANTIEPSVCGGDAVLCQLWPVV